MQMEDADGKCDREGWVERMSQREQATDEDS
jgi:hypothetical protein